MVKLLSVRLRQMLSKTGWSSSGVEATSFHSRLCSEQF
jgi:hypothetical protein